MPNTKCHFAFSDDVSGDGGSLIICADQSSAELLPSNTLEANQALLDSLFGEGNTVLSGDWNTGGEHGLFIQFLGVYADSNVPVAGWSSTLGVATISLSRDYTSKWLHKVFVNDIGQDDENLPLSGGTYEWDGVTYAHNVVPNQGGWFGNGNPGSNGFFRVYKYTHSADGFAAPSYDFSGLLQSDGSPTDTSPINADVDNALDGDDVEDFDLPLECGMVTITLVNAASGSGTLFIDQGLGDGSLAMNPIAFDATAEAMSASYDWPTLEPQTGLDAGSSANLSTLETPQGRRIYSTPISLDSIDTTMFVDNGTLTSSGDITVTATVSQQGGGGAGGGGSCLRSTIIQGDAA